jgi:hypothetical protein
MSTGTLYYETGQTVAVTGSFYENEQLVDPATVSVVVTKPDGTTLTPAPIPVRLTTGKWFISLTLTNRGTWGVRFTGTSPDTATDIILVADWSSQPGGGQTLVSLQEYRDITRDNDTENEAVQTYLTEAVELVEEFLQRKLASQTITEIVEVWTIDGGTYAYPTVTPITAVPPGSVYTIDHGNSRLRGVSLLSESILTGGSGLLGDGNPYKLRERPLYTQVTYTGGYTNTTLPQTLKRAIARVAFGLSRITTASVIGAQSLRVGDVSVTYPSLQGGIDTLAPGVSLMIKPYKRKRVRF